MSRAAPPGFRGDCQRLVDQATAGGWHVEGEQAIPYGRMFRFTNGTSGATLSCYHGKRGFRFVTAGKEGDALGALLGRKPTREVRAQDPGGRDPFSAGLPRVGADESGKGDYFGPLVVAAFYADESTLAALHDLGVRDSKSLGRQQALRMAGKIDALGRGEVLALAPDDYGPRYEELRNVNHLLSDMHGACISALLRRANQAGWDAPRSVVVDRFSTRNERLDHAIVRARDTDLITVPRAEADLAVAAASILARAAFLEGLKDLESRYGVPFPPGAGTPVLTAGRAFVRDFGRDELHHVAKVHFATTKQL